jgi:hypothetical protein
VPLYNPAGITSDDTIIFSDITTNNASTTKHGFLRKLSGSSTDVLKGDGTFGAASGGGNFTLITDTLLAVDTANFDFTSIPGTYTHLFIVTLTRSDNGGGSFDFILMRFNNDSGTNYDYANSAGSSTGASSAQMGVTTGATATSGAPGTLNIMIPNYTGTTFWKQADGFGGDARGVTNSGLSAGTWKNTAAITRITIFPSSGTHWVAGSRATLYGLN